MGKRSELKYVEVANRIESLIDNDVLKTGDKLLSVRALSKEQGISLSTAFQAYYLLESKGLVEARPQSGYYVKFSPRQFPQLPTPPPPPKQAVSVSIDEAVRSVYRELNDASIINFSVAVPSIDLLPTAKLNKSIVQSLRDSPASCLNYEEVQGNSALRKQIAKLAFNWGGVYKEEDIIVTAGCMEAISLCLRAVTKPGDAVALESPTYYAFFLLMESLGLKVVEIPTQPGTGVDLDYLEDAIKQFKIKACLFVPNFDNPMGSCIPDDRKKYLVDLLAKHEIPLIEDDIYGELYFGKSRPRTCKSYDKRGMVLHCASFSKALSPGYRIGWVIPGKFKDQILKLKRINSISTNNLAQAGLAHFLSVGRYELHLRNLRKALHTQSLRMAQAISEYFPDDIKMNRPLGGFTFWIELDKQIDTYKLHKKAIRKNIGIAPGMMFSSKMKFKNFLRLSYGEPWSERIDEALKLLGKMIKASYTNP